MTMPDERTGAVLKTRQFLQELASGECAHQLPHGMRRKALTLLRHYPQASDMELAHLALPRWFGSPWVDGFSRALGEEES